jgi:phosphotransferase system HPr (HPr) family protein
MKTSAVTLMDPVGLHARPAALFVALANQFSADISIRNLSAGGPWVNAKSILSLLTCGVQQGDQIGIQAEGLDEFAAIEALEKLVRSNFNEDKEIS